MPRTQLAIRIPVPLLERLQDEAKQRSATVTSLVLAWVEAGLDGRMTTYSSPSEQRIDNVMTASGAALAERMDELTRRLDEVAMVVGLKGGPQKGTAVPAQQMPSAASALVQEVLARNTVDLRDSIESGIVPPALKQMAGLPPQTARSATTALITEVLPLPERRLTPEEAEGLTTLPAVALELGLGGRGSSITNWISRAAKARGVDVPLGSVYRGWRLRGKALLPGGQKPGWLFDRA
jgi:hypothetical protein